MKKKYLVGLTCGVLMLGMAGIAAATLTTIGTATYGGSDYNLIWDNDNNGKSVVWLDYTSDHGIWDNQVAWAGGLNAPGALVYKWFTGYSVNWGSNNNWRLPTSGGIQGWDDTLSELGHLYFTEFGLKSYPDRGNQVVSSAELNTTNFDHLTPMWYWTGMENPDLGPDYVYSFHLEAGGAASDLKYRSADGGYAIAVRTGQVNSPTPTPEPASMLLMGTGLVGLIGARRKKL